MRYLSGGLSTRKIVQLALVASFISLFNASVFATVVGKVITVAGDVTVSGAAIKRGATIATGQTVKTGPASMVQLRFDDGTLISLREKSEYRVDTYEKKEGDVKKVSTLLKGGLRSLTEQDGKSHDNELKTAVAIIGIRGTLLNVYLPNKKTIYAGCSQGCCQVKGRSFGCNGGEKYFSQTVNQPAQFSNTPPPGLIVGVEDSMGKNALGSSYGSTMTNNNGSAANTDLTSFTSLTSVTNTAISVIEPPNNLQINSANSLVPLITNPSTYEFSGGFSTTNPPFAIGSLIPFPGATGNLVLNNIPYFANPVIADITGAIYQGNVISSQQIIAEDEGGTGLYWGEWSSETCTGSTCGALNNNGNVNVAKYPLLWVVGPSTPKSSMPTQGQISFTSFLLKPQGNSSDGPITGGNVDVKVDFGAGQITGIFTVVAGSAQWVDGVRGNIGTDRINPYFTLVGNLGTYTNGGISKSFTDSTGGTNEVGGFFSGKDAKWLVNFFSFLTDDSSAYAGGISIWKH